MIKTIHHLLTGTKWGKIQQEGVLKPLSDPWFDLSSHKDTLPEIITQDTYLVGIPEGLIGSWKKYKELDDLVKYIRDKGVDMPDSDEQVICLDVPVIQAGGFVREYKFRTPKFMNSTYPNLYYLVRDAYMSCGMSDCTKEQWAIYNSLIERFMFSAVPLEEYDGSFKVPEVWLPQQTPIELIHSQRFNPNQ